MLEEASAFARVIQGTRELTNGLDITRSMRDDNLARLERALADLDARSVGGRPIDLRNLDQPVVELETRASELKLSPNLPAHATTTTSAGTQAANPSATASALRSRPPATSPALLGALDPGQNADKLLRLRRLIDLQRSLGRELGRGIER